MKGDFKTAEKTFRRVVTVDITGDEATDGIDSNMTDDTAAAAVVALRAMLQFADLLYVW